MRILILRALDLVCRVNFLVSAAGSASDVRINSQMPSLYLASYQAEDCLSCMAIFRIANCRI